MSLLSLIDVMKRVRDRFPSLSKRISEAEALTRWEIAVGPAISKHSRAIRVQDSVLWVEVDHPIWKSELHHRKHQILAILNAGEQASPSRPPKAAPRTSNRSHKHSPKCSPKCSKDQPPPALPPLKDILFLDMRGDTRGGPK